MIMFSKVVMSCQRACQITMHSAQPRSEALPVHSFSYGISAAHLSLHTAHHSNSAAGVHRFQTKLVPPVSDHTVTTSAMGQPLVAFSRVLQAMYHSGCKSSHIFHSCWCHWARLPLLPHPVDAAEHHHQGVLTITTKCSELGPLVRLLSCSLLSLSSSHADTACGCYV